jgi:signal transduction histidine kinase
MLLDLHDERRTFLSAAPAEAGSRRLALWVLIASGVVFIAAVPFAKTPLLQVPAFIPVYQSAMVVCDLITAVLLFGQFRISRSRAALLLACGYVFTALMAIAHGLSFPGLFAPGGLMGSGPQTTAWIYFLWHAGFPLYVLAYARLSSRADDAAKESTTGTVAVALAGTLAAALAITLLTTLGHALLPVIMRGDADASRKVMVAAATWAFTFAALIVLWRRRPHSVMDLWLMVTLCAWIFDVGLASVFNGGRYDLGYYAGRVYGFGAASFVLVVLLTENSLLYSRLLHAYAAERTERQKVQERTAELAAANKQLDAFSYSVSHDLRAPLRAVDGYARILEEDFGSRMDEEGRRLLAVVRASAKKMGVLIDDLLEFARQGRGQPAKRAFNMGELVTAVAAEQAKAYPRAELRVAALPDAPADPVLLRQIWVNLVGNAFKYSSKRDAPLVEIGARTEAAEIVYWVRDNGAGFDMRFAQRLFGVFQRLHTAEEFSGTGVGLAIVERIVSRHGGRVWAESQLDEGATFYFTLPVGASAGEQRL